MIDLKLAQLTQDPKYWDGIVDVSIGAWLECVPSLGETVRHHQEMRRLEPGRRAIAEAEAALLWLRWLEPRDARLVWLRANRVARSAHRLVVL